MRLVWIRAAIVGAVVLTTVAFLLAFFVAAPAPFGEVRIPAAQVSGAQLGPNQPVGVEGDNMVFLRWDMGQKIFYFHVPVAEASFLVFLFAAVYGGLFLAKRDRKWDTRSRIAMEVTLFFVLLTMVTGVIWTKWAWGVWWQWEPRLTTYFIMTLLVVAYFVLRNSVEDEERRATYAAVFAIVAFIDAPISFLITRVLPSTHPVVFKSGGLDGWQLATFIIAQLGMLLFGFAVYELRLHEERLGERLEVLKNSLGG